MVPRLGSLVMSILPLARWARSRIPAMPRCSPVTPGKPVRFRVRIDGTAPGASHGVDVDAEGNGTASQQRMYQLVRQNGEIGDRTFEIEFLDESAQAFVFTFG